MILSARSHLQGLETRVVVAFVSYSTSGSRSRLQRKPRIRISFRQISAQTAYRRVDKSADSQRPGSRHACEPRHMDDYALDIACQHGKGTSDFSSLRRIRAHKPCLVRCLRYGHRICSGNCRSKRRRVNTGKGSPRTAIKHNQRISPRCICDSQ